MAVYCLRCGAYIPDGQSKCVACGYDPNEKPKTTGGVYKGASSASAAAQSDRSEKSSAAGTASDNFKQTYEEQRRQQKENARKWAEQAYVEYHRATRSADTEKRPDAADEDESGKSSNSRVFSILSYVNIMFLLTYLFAPDDEYAKFHAKQGATLFGATIAGEIIGSFFGFGWVVGLLSLVYSIKGIKNANDGKKETLPFLDKLSGLKDKFKK